MAKFRVVRNDLGFYPQVRKMFRWYKIAKHNTGFGLYYNNIAYPHPTLDSALKVIEDYKEYHSKRLKTIQVWPKIVNSK